MAMRRQQRFAAPSNAMKFDNFEPVLSEEEKASYFMARYNEIVDPFERYSNFWKSTAIDFDITLSHIKNSFKRLVLRGSWDEDKFVTVTNEIFERELGFTQFTYDKFGKMYDSDDLNSEPRRRRQSERRRR